jgi:hypothetical protein
MNDRLSTVRGIMRGALWGLVAWALILMAVWECAA